jgi:outer membrane biosynthesis protein TonB
MEYNAQPAPSTSSPVQQPSRQPVRQPEFRIRYGRTALALTGAVAIVVFVAGGVLALAGAVSGQLPGFALLAAIAVVVILRSLAIRDRRNRAAARADRAARTASASQAAGMRTPTRPTQLFDGAAAEAQPAPEAAPAAPAPLTAAELREQALKVAAEAGDTAAPVRPSGTPWQPVDVPKPTYVAAAKANRPAPAPLPAPEVKKPQVKTSIKQTTAQRTEEAAAQRSAEAAEQHDGETATTVEASGQPSATNRLNLDDVLQRRRA